RLSALAMASTTDAIVIADARLPDYPIVYANAAFELMTGYRADELMGQNCRLLQGSETSQPEITEIREALGAGRAARVTLRNFRKDGSLFWNQLTLSPVRDEHHVLTHFIGIQTDVTAGKRFEAELLHRATHDALTGLPNQHLLEERLEAALRDADRDGTLVAVGFIGIDRLKRVNHSLGHAGGDALICAVAARLSAAVRARDIVARYGGDEFVIVLRDLEDGQVAEGLMRRLRHILTEPLLIGGVELTPSVSVGLALYPQDATRIVDLIRIADTVMYDVKASGRGNFEFFDGARMQPATDRLEMENALRRAVCTGSLGLAYQPIYDARTGRVSALEALLRWRDPVLGEIGPDQFIPLAEESGLIVPIGEWVLREVCRQHAAWKSSGVPLVTVALNVSVMQLRRRDFAASFKAIVADAGIDPHWIAIEITESIVMDDMEQFFDILSELRAIGVRVSIDDFGTGFSSLKYLKRLSADSLKIDKSFVDDIAHDGNAAAICKAIVTLAHSVNLTVIAEGVETTAQATFLGAIGCDELQGYYFARPSHPEAIALLLVADRVTAA
ncbi:MAG: EAL domain-containing protein, partial [Candidatus Eremiobacteraeota bacterium]|nr:EAL domain-containing protein [Candidatus Eremiobacteraeota bacterium]